MADLIDRQVAIETIFSEPLYEPGMEKRDVDAVVLAIYEKIKALPPVQPEILASGEGELNVPDTDVGDMISRQAAIDALGEEPEVLTGKDEYAQGLNNQWHYDRNAIMALPSAQPERTCVNCGRTVNNGGWYADGETRCPIEEHYALPKDGYCHLWEKRNVTDDNYPERREE